ncbi:MAG: DUF7482 domain-containing protein [Anaerolineales bacterium]
MKPIFLLLSLLMVLGVACSATGDTGMAGMQDMQAGTAAGQSSQDFAPLVMGYYNGGEVLFIHTEASDAGVAGMLTEMMGPQVVVAPQLANVPQSTLGEVYVFTNGVSGMGPFGYQPDVFDSVPGEAGYSPLRRVNLVTWAGEATARLLQSVDEIMQAEADGELVIEPTEFVVNMPILVWPRGER